jgi:hypothetical protein
VSSRAVNDHSKEFGKCRIEDKKLIEQVIPIPESIAILSGIKNQTQSGFSNPKMA